MDLNADVICSHDPKRNYLSLLHEIEPAHYMERDPGWVDTEADTENCVVLWPS